MTNVGTGLSGITETSPALSIASQAGTAAFTVFTGGQYQIYALDNVNARPFPCPARGRRRGDAAARRSGARRDRDAPRRSPNAGFRRRVEYPVEEYRSGLSLEAVGQPTIAVGVGPASVRQSAAACRFRFGDMLGDQVLVAAVQLNSGMSSDFSFKNTGGPGLRILNRARRWNWGLVGGQIPYLSGGVQQGDRLDQRGAGVVQSERDLPPDRAQRGGPRRVPVQPGAARRVPGRGQPDLVRSDRSHARRFRCRTGQLLLDETDETSLGDSLLLGTSSAALVYDTTSFGATSPVQGQRYRFEVSPTFGSVPFTGALVDYRRYFMPVPFYTFAAPRDALRPLRQRKR